MQIFRLEFIYRDATDPRPGPSTTWHEIEATSKTAAIRYGKLLAQSKGWRLFQVLPA